MGVQIRSESFTTMAKWAIAVLLVSCFLEQKTAAVRLLDEEQWLAKNLIVQSLQRGPVPPSGGNPCTFIPGRNRGRCTLSEMDVAGQFPRAPAAAFPDIVVDFGAVTAGNSGANETQKQDSSS
ncbi:uncharacterized protein LOC110807772 [Carica papaya]|uniref:uncharacterized protein LOC110807772 n=1 Tax=Carica papaya TaxID=3649 RepID=UPI000B8CCC21|nr:uncharacterized protein LOC110807772 [Carica papaya]